MLAEIMAKIENGVYDNSEPFVTFEHDPVGHRRWYDRERACVSLFREDAIESVGLKDHPKADQAFNLAWDMSDGGFEDVLRGLAGIAFLLLTESEVIEPEMELCEV